MGRAKKSRTIELDIPQMVCHCFAPVWLSSQQIEEMPKTMIEPDELQSLVYQDIDRLTMDQACIKMWVSKTVYAGIYASARNKVTQALVEGSILRICHTI